MDECVPQALSNMIWACATLRHEHPRFVYAVAASASPRLHTFQSQTLANTLWAYSVLGVYPPELFQNAAEEMVRRMNDTERKSRGEGDNGSGSEGGWSENEGKPAWENGAASGGYTGHTSQNRFNTKRAAMCEFRGQEISNVLIAYARGCIIHPGLLHAVERELCRTPSQDSSEPGNADEVLYVERLTDFTSQALANTLWAFATLRWYPARLLPRITEAMPSIVPSMTSQELANSLWAYARFAYHPGRVMATFLAVIERRTDEFEGQGCTNSLWALAVLKATHSAAFVGLLQRYVQLERTSNMFGELQYNQVLQAVLLAQFEARGGRVAWRPEVDLPEDLVDRALNAWASQQTSTQLSGFHLDVSEGLVRLGIAHGIEYLVARNLLSIDIAVTTEGRQIAIEVDGPFHFPVNARTPLGHTMIRRRLLRAAGWTVVSIPWYEWFAMQTWEDRLQYLAEILSRADETLVQQLRPAVRDLLSTDFAPGPGVDADDEEADLESAVPGTLEAGGSPRSSMRSILEPPRLAPDRGLDIGEDGPVLSYSTNDPENDVETGLMEVLGRSNIQLTSGAIRRLQSMGLEDVVRQIGERKKAGGRNSKSGSFAAGTTSSLYGSAGSRPDMYCPPPSMRRGEDNEPGVLLPKPSRLRGPNVRRSSKARFNPHFLNSPSTWGFYPHEHQDSEMKPSGGSASSRRREWPTNEAARSTMDQAQPEHVGDNDTSPHAGEQGAGGEGGSGVDVVVVNAEGGLEAVPPPEGHGGGDSISEDK